ncbi:hypothetical protein AM587_10001080 [Phytophthora nicotianae]|uniref:Uncharacterized protein n=1 Tax=Phytophthora nicotianae TaxID=4792 RepID=A0A0W8CRU2_PHYNI|nr:hypothetical protein AM587_10001080 [Phytophthora nicotianae]
MEIMAGVRVACRADSRIQPLGHVVQMIDEFADVSPFWTLLGAVKLGSARLVHRVLCHTCESLRDQNNLQQFEHATRPAAVMGNLQVMQLLHEVGVVALNNTTAVAAALSGDLSFLKWVQATAPRLFHHARSWAEQVEFDVAAERGCLNTVQWLVEAFPGTVWSLGPAALGGNLETVKWLHEHANLGEEGCTPDAVDHAAGSGHLDVVQFLYANRTEGGTAIAAVLTEERGMFEVLRLFAEQNIGLVIPGEEDEDL